jgi:hypothetical protein
LYRAETRSRHCENKTKLETAEMSILRKMLGETRLEHVRSQDIGTDVEYTAYSHIDKSKPILFFFLLYVLVNLIFCILYICAKAFDISVSYKKLENG